MHISKNQDNLWSTDTTEYYTIITNNETEALATGVNKDLPNNVML